MLSNGSYGCPSWADSFLPGSRLFSETAIVLAMPAVLLFLILVYEIRMDRWEKTVSAPIRLDMFAEIPIMILCLVFGVWQIILSRRRKEY